MSSAVVDVKFYGPLPRFEALYDDERRQTAWCSKWRQHLCESTVRTVAMDISEGLGAAGGPPYTGEPISVPVGDETLGRIINVIASRSTRTGPVKTTLRCDPPAAPR